MAFPLPVWLAIQDELTGHGGAAKSCFDDFDDDALFEAFHLTRPCLSFIADYIRARVDGVVPSRPALTADALIMVALNFYAHRISSVSILQKVGLSLTDCTAVICAVSEVIAGTCDQFVSFPRSREARAGVARKVEALCGIPDVLGGLGTAHFKIRASPYEKDAFRTFVNTLGYTSVLSQIMCDSDGNVLSVERCHVGSTSQQEIWDSSLLGREVEGGLHGPYWVVGGNGYNLTKHVLTPVSQPATDKETSFNEAHAKMHNVLRSTIGCMKARFRCLMQLGFANEGSLEKKSNIIKTCCVLHNIAKKFSVPSLPTQLKVEHLDPVKKRSVPLEINSEALKARQELIDGILSNAPSSKDVHSESITEEDE